MLAFSYFSISTRQRPAKLVHGTGAKLQQMEATCRTLVNALCDRGLIGMGRRIQKLPFLPTFILRLANRKAKFWQLESIQDPISFFALFNYSKKCFAEKANFTVFVHC